ncbi:MAG: repeat-like domain [Frankiaceae bacterium]|nr:repeat-like domain [Frankiaceae bacterium]
MQRRLAWLGLTGLALGCTALAVPSGAATADRTAPYGGFGFTTVGLGTGPSYGEPSLAMAPDGKHYAVSTPGDDGNGNGTVQVWHSADRGVNWGHSTFTSDAGGGDSELDFRPDGSLIGADLEVTDSEIHTSTDFGTTWDAQGSQAGQEQDRQWFAHTPDGKREFLVYHDFVLEGEFYVESDDGGQTWGNPVLIQDLSQAMTPPGVAVGPVQGSVPSVLDQGINTFSGPMMVDKNGQDMYVVYAISNFESNVSPQGGGIPPFGAVRGLVVAHSSNGGTTWSNKYAVVAQNNPTDPSKEESVGTMFPWGFLDPAGTVYVVFGSTRNNGGGTDHYNFYYVYSKDKGAHWSAPKRIDGLPQGQGSIVFNTGAAVSPGLIDVAWLQKDSSAIGTESGVWSPWFAQISGADTANPVITRQKITTVPNHKNGVCILGTICALPAPVNPGSDDRSLLDFIELAVNPTTHLAGLVYADNGAFSPRPGSEVVFAAQTKQPKIATPPAKHTGGTGTTAGSGGTSGGKKLAGTGGSPVLPIVALGLMLAAGAGVGLTRALRR